MADLQFKAEGEGQEALTLSLWAIPIAIAIVSAPAWQPRHFSVCVCDINTDTINVATGICWILVLAGIWGICCCCWLLVAGWWSQVELVGSVHY